MNEITTMPKRKRREINKVRTSHLEKVIASHLFKGEYAEADAITKLAHSIGAPIDEKEIAVQVELYRKIEEQSKP